LEPPQLFVSGGSGYLTEPFRVPRLDRLAADLRELRVPETRKEHPIEHRSAPLSPRWCKRGPHGRPVAALHEIFEPQPFLADSEDFSLCNRRHRVPVDDLGRLVIGRRLLPVAPAVRVVEVNPPPPTPLEETVTRA
jgi:hypothetical protein